MAQATSAQGEKHITAFRALAGLPILGITKRYDGEGRVYITPDFQSASAVSEAGADISEASADVSEAGADVSALDCTIRRLTEAEPWPGLIRRIHGELQRVMCTDIATLDDALAAEVAGADPIATTLRGYTHETAHVREVDWRFLETLLASIRTPVILEWHVDLPDRVRRALDLGVHAVVVGSAITRPQTITARFVAAMRPSSPRPWGPSDADCIVG